MASSIHYAPEGGLGDVHPYYDAASGQWYLFYLKTDGAFSAALSVSRDMLHFEERDIDCQGPQAAYFVLGVQPFEESFYSWYGAGTSMAASRSRDLLHWENAGSACAIPMGYTTFVGMRDPYVFFDEDAGVWRMVCTAYRTNQLQGKGLGMKCALALASAAGASPEQWGAVETTLVSFPDGLHGEPECPQMMKIGDRWYLFCSLARRHENHVGRLSYYIGDPGAGILEQDWNQKTEHVLTSEDVCAAQVCQGADGIYLWGWIASHWNGGGWGGQLCLPLRVEQLADGQLCTRLAPSVSAALRGELLARGTDSVSAELNGFDAEMRFTVEAGEQARITAGASVIVLDESQHLLAIEDADGTRHVSMPLSAGNGQAEHTLRILAEGDILEVFLDDRYALAARTKSDTACDSITLSGATGQAMAVYSLQCGETSCK